MVDFNKRRLINEPVSSGLYRNKFCADEYNIYIRNGGLPVVTNTNYISELQQRIALYDDMKAYHELYDLFFNRLHHFCFSFVKSSEAAEEIVSDIFIKVWQIRNKLAEIKHLKVYLYTIAKNFCLNYISKNFKNPVISIDKIDFELVVNLQNPEESCISSGVINSINQAIAQLPSQCKLIFKLVKEDGLPYKEVAGILNISAFTVRNQVAIATKKIAELLPEYKGTAQLVKTTRTSQS